MRLRYGLGCGRAHSVKAIARAFAMTPEVMGGILMQAQRRLADKRAATAPLAPPEQLIAGIRDGVNIVTGDYSRGAVGLWIRNGELAFPVSEVTLPGLCSRCR